MNVKSMFNKCNEESLYNLIPITTLVNKMNGYYYPH